MPKLDRDGDSIACEK
ncbi:excalibur calcium-binding domain-containing protein [Paenibacillus sp. MBLB4367]